MPVAPFLSRRLRFLGPAFWGPLSWLGKRATRFLAKPWYRLRAEIGLPPTGEGNPLLAPVVQQSWIAFVLLKGALVPMLIVQLYRYRRDNPVLATAGMGIVTIALTVALGCWIGWIAAVLSVGRAVGF